MDLNEYFAPLTTFAQWEGDPAPLAIANGLQMKEGHDMVIPTSLKFVHLPREGESNRLYGITMGFSDDTSFKLGQAITEPTFTYTEFKLQPGERFTKWEWIEETNKMPNFPESTFNAAGCRFETQFGRKLEVHPKNTVVKRTRTVSVDVGSGLLLGAQAMDTNPLYTCSLFFLKPVKSLYLKEVQYTTTPTLQDAPIHMVPYLSKHFDNNTARDTTWTISERHTDTESFSWTVALAVGLSMTTGVSASVFDLVEVNDQVTWSIDASVSTTSEQTESKEVSWEFSGSHAPHTKVDIALTYGKGKMDLSFRGTMEVTMANGAVWTGPVGGKYAQTAVGVGEISATEHAIAHES